MAYYNLFKNLKSCKKNINIRLYWLCS